jgi:Ca2+-binding EF-hand superfamily protein
MNMQPLRFIASLPPSPPLRGGGVRGEGASLCTGSPPSPPAPLPPQTGGEGRWKRAARAGLSAVGVLVMCLAVTADPPAADNAPVAVPDGHEFVLLTEARPVLIRVHAQLDGKPVQAAWDEYMAYLFGYLDTNADGVLTGEEIERAPPLDQILTGGLGRAFGGGGMGKAPAAPTLADIDTDKDGRVTLAELAAYYRKSGFLPVQVQPDGTGGNPLGALALYGGRRPEPTVEAVAEAIFTMLDTNKDGKLTRDELAAAPAVLLARDENDDEMIVPSEIAPGPKSSNALSGMMAMGGVTPTAKPNKHLLPVTTPGEVPADLVKRLQEKYGAPVENMDEVKLSAKDLGLDAAIFARLDTNEDGVLDAAELAGFVKRTADLALTIRIGRLQGGAARVELPATKDGPAPLASKLQLKGAVARLDLGRTRVDLQTQGNDYGPDRIGGILRQQLLAQFKQADKDKNGYLDAKEAAASGTFRGVYKAMDRDGDGKVYESEVIAYFDQLANLQQRARAACVTLVLTNQSRGLFDLLDVDRDGRLGVREMRGAGKVLDQLDTEHKGYLERKDLPHSYQLAMRQGPASTPAAGGAAVFELYRVSAQGDGLPERTEGPLWFRKMDRNRDGDVSRREFLGTDEQFRRIDTDGDGLISVEEATRFDDKSRKQP